MKTTSIYIFIGLMLSAPFCPANVIPAADLKEIPAEQIGRLYVIMGRLGIPLGTNVTLQGEVIQRHPHSGLEFKVEKLNDEPVAKATVLKLRAREGIEISRYLGKRIVLVGQEIGKFEKIELINQVDRKTVGNMGCDVSFVADRVSSIEEKK